jgi:phosphate transport system substrate-binding protein
MNPILRALLVLAVLATPSAAQVRLTGAGATFPDPVYQRWFEHYAKRNNVRINYQPLGSGAGIRQFVQGTVDFGASDGPMTDAEIAEVGGNVVHLPTVLGAVAVTYNLPALGATRLKLDGPLIADLFLGRITRWNDPRIAAVNPGVPLPAEDVVVVHRSDGSGTTFVFTDYLAKVSPAWAGQVGTRTAVRWPVGLGGRGNEGVTAQVKQLTGSIGYVELAYAEANQLPAAEVKNRSGRSIAPDVASVSAAAATTTFPTGGDLRVSITDPPGSDAYPIASFTWLLVRRRWNDQARSAAMKGFLEWMTTPEAQGMGTSLGYAPLPAPVAELVRNEVAGLR